MDDDGRRGPQLRGAVLLLAAGSSRRFGTDKRRARLADGRTVLEASYAAVAAAGLPVLPCHAAADRAAPPLPGVEAHFAAGAERGMGATLASGAAALGPVDFVLIALGDMPWLQGVSVATIAASAARETIVVPVFAGRRGHPVAFGADFIGELCELDGDRGARDVLARHPDAICELSVDDPGVLRDVDRPGDLETQCPPGSKQ